MALLRQYVPTLFGADRQMIDNPIKESTMLTTTRRVKLRESASTEAANPQGVVRGGDIIEKIGAEENGWVNIRVFGPGNAVREGWIETKYLKEATAPEPLEINLEKFALAALYNARDFNNNAYYLIALAHVLSGIENKVDPDTKARGPYQFTSEQWQGLLSLHAEELADARQRDIDDPVIQSLVAALLVREATTQLQAILPDRRLPTANELFLCQLLGLPMAKHLLSGDLTEGVNTSLKRYFSARSAPDEEVEKVLTKHSGYLTAETQPRTLEQILDAISGPLDAGLKRAAELLEALPDDERASLLPGEPSDTNAPWMILAKAEIGQTEDMRKGHTNERITEYHAVSFAASPRLDDIAWCAAFVSWCMAQCEDEKVRSANIKSALAADWIKWGTAIEQPVYGALVVLEPLVDGSSGHVGFAVGVQDDYVLLLGGNQRDLKQVGQPDAVCIRKFRLSKVRGFRWLAGISSSTQHSEQQTSDVRELKITLDHLKAISGRNTLNDTASEILTAFNKYAAQFGLTTQKAVAFALANFSIETGGFQQLEENLNYTAQRLREVWPSRFETLQKAQEYAGNPQKLATYVYGNRLGNAGKQDAGWKYRGSGPGQVTGYANFLTVENITGMKVTQNPDLLRQADEGMKAALLLWQKWSMNSFVEGPNLFLTAGRKRWNGGTHGLKEMKAAYKRAMEINLVS